ncbi:BAR domain-containing protein [Portibacter marinus]|uniref:hypothetical protein n=1 Tax=Portibacter marinus TaxID=2898660 RepID=UPI001F23B14B|nr:hypothetical protein [Portibacter marinus]
MKNFTLLLTCSFIFLFTALHSQKIQYTDGNIEFEDQTVETINIYLEPQVEKVEDRFEEWMRDNYDVNLRDKKFLFFDRDVMIAKEVIIPEVSDRKIDLRVQVDQSIETSSVLHVFASFGYDNWITRSTHPEEHEALKDIVYEFIVDYLPEYYTEKVEDRKEIYGDLAEEIEEIEQEIAENKEEIRENRAEIEEMMNTNEELANSLKENQRRLREARMKVRNSQKTYDAILDRINVMKKN